MRGVALIWNTDTATLRLRFLQGTIELDLLALEQWNLLPSQYIPSIARMDFPKCGRRESSDTLPWLALGSMYLNRLKPPEVSDTCTTIIHSKY